MTLLMGLNLGMAQQEVTMEDEPKNSKCPQELLTHLPLDQYPFETGTVLWDASIIDCEKTAGNNRIIYTISFISKGNNPEERRAKLDTYLEYVTDDQHRPVILKYLNSWLLQDSRSATLLYPSPESPDKASTYN